MNKRIFIWLVPILLISIIVMFSIEESRIFIINVAVTVFLFIKHNILAILAAFFLVKGKFILTLFLKKIVLLSVTGLGKRYVIEKVINHNFKIYFLDHISDDIKRLVVYVKENFKDFPLVKQIIAGFAFLGSLGFVGKFMGSMLAMKVFIAKFWSFLLVIFLKVGTAVVYFFTDYLWGSWIAPIVEVVIFSWLLTWMEKVPFLARGLRKIYAFFIKLFQSIEYVLERVFHIPVKAFLKWLVKKIQNKIYRFIGYSRVSAYQRLKQMRILTPNVHTKLMNKRKAKKTENKKQDNSRQKVVRNLLSSRERLLQKRNTRK